MIPDEVTIIIKSPSSEAGDPLRLSIPLDSTVLDIKERISQQHPEQPKPKDQRLIFAGKLLLDSLRTEDVLHQHDTKQPQTFHLVLPVKETEVDSAVLSTMSCASISTTLPDHPRHSTTALGVSSTPVSTGMGPEIPARIPSAATNVPAPCIALSGELRGTQVFHDQAASAASAAIRNDLPLVGMAPCHPGLQQSAPVPVPSAYWYYAYSALGQVRINPLAAPARAPAGFQWHMAELDDQPYVFALPAAFNVATPMPTAPAAVAAVSRAAIAVAGQPPRERGVAGGAGNGSRQVESREAAGAAVNGDEAVPPAADGGGVDLELNGEEGEEGRTDALKLILKLAFFVYLLGQDGNAQRSVLLGIAAVVIFLAQTGWLGWCNRFVTPFGPTVRTAAPAPTNNNIAAGTDGAAEGESGTDTGVRGTDGAAEGESGTGTGAGGRGADDGGSPESLAVLDDETQWQTVYRNVESVVSAFFASLSPSFRAQDPNEDQLPDGPGIM